MQLREHDDLCRHLPMCAPMCVCPCLFVCVQYPSSRCSASWLGSHLPAAGRHGRFHLLHTAAISCCTHWSRYHTHAGTTIECIRSRTWKLIRIDGRSRFYHSCVICCS